MPDPPATSASRALTHLTGSRLAWSRDLAVVCGGSGLLAPLIIFGPMSMSLSSGAAGVVTGAIIGLGVPRLLEFLRKRVPLKLLGLTGFGVGGLWGAVVGAAAALPNPWGTTILGTTNTIVAATLIGALVIGCFWLPYTVATVMKIRRWPVVAGAVAASPLVGWAVFSLFL